MTESEEHKHNWFITQIGYSGYLSNPPVFLVRYLCRADHCDAETFCAINAEDQQ